RCLSDWSSDVCSSDLYIHADMHTIAFNPNNSSQFIMGTDGGVFRCNDAADTYPLFESVDRKYNVTQTYGVAAKTTGEILMGCQRSEERRVGKEWRAEV